MHDRIASGEERIAAFLADKLRPALYRNGSPMDVGAWHIAGEPFPADVALRAEYTPFAVGEPWGRPWATTWFRVRATIPERWTGHRVEAICRPRFRLRRRPRRRSRARRTRHTAAGTSPAPVRRAGHRVRGWR